MTIIAWRENWGHRVDMSITRRERKRKGVKNMAQNQIEIYAAEKRLQLLLNKKFEMLEKLHPVLSGERQEIIETYSTLFDCMDDAIVQESKVVVKNEKRHHQAELDESRLDEIAKRIFIELQGCVDVRR